MPGSGSDQIAPLVGLSLVKGDLVVVPLVQHFVEYDGLAVNQTAIRVIAIQSLPKAFWAKLDTIVPFDWENDRDSCDSRDAGGENDDLELLVSMSMCSQESAVIAHTTGAWVSE